MSKRVTFIRHSRAYYHTVNTGNHDEIAIALEDHPDAGEFIIRWVEFDNKDYAFQLVATNEAWRTLNHFSDLLAFLRDEASSRYRPTKRQCMMPDEVEGILRQRFGYIDVTPTEMDDE